MSGAADQPGPVIPPARIRYHNDQPYSLDFDDIYHAGDGEAEVLRVFVAPTGLDELTRQRSHVRIGELGFGSGYNFVVAAERCLAAGAGLHFISFEACPIDAENFAVIARQRRARHSLYSELARAYPPRIRGWHRRWLAGGRVCLSLWFGDAAVGLADLDGRQRQGVDAWFLDGFAPDRNPGMWTPVLCRRLAGLSRPGSAVATFTAAGRVRRALTEAGFHMRRVDQRPHKRESLAGIFRGPGLTGFAPPERVVIAGAGLAGASAAFHLARAGCAVRVHAPAPQAGPAPASLTPATALHGRLLADGTPAAALRCHGYLYAAQLAREFSACRATGVVQLAGGTQGEAKLDAVLARYAASGAWLEPLSADGIAELAGYPVAERGLYFPDGAVVETPALTAELLELAAAEQVTERLGERLGECLDALPRDVPVILACGPATRNFRPARYLELAPVHGQVDFVSLHAPPRLPLVGNGYLVPAGPGQLAAGATYEYREWDVEEATRANLKQLEGRPYTWLRRHRGTRSVTSDRIPIAGQLVDRYGEGVPHTYVSTGHGSSGNVSAHLAGAVLAAQLTGEFPPLSRDLEAALSPRRFRERQARRGYRHGASD